MRAVTQASRPAGPGSGGPLLWRFVSATVGASGWPVEALRSSSDRLRDAPASRWPGNLPQEVYVWQRAWTEPVRRAVAEHGRSFARVVVLAAEVTWEKNRPRLVRIPLDFKELARAKTPLGLALRIGPFSGSFDASGEAATYLAGVARSLVAEAAAARVPISEFQVDFDCASSKIDGYRSWVAALRKEVSPRSLVVTALPTWLNETSFKALARATDGYVLQVHSLERPKSYDAPFTLCDPQAARRAVLKAGEIGVPFRVALPTYGYTVGFDKHGRFVGLLAEGPAKSWPADVRTKQVRADPEAMAGLVIGWGSNRPPAMKGIIWYRLPVPGDSLNWSWPTLHALIQARVPRKSVGVESRRVQPGLVEVRLVNDGERDVSSRFRVRARWRGARFLAGDGLGGFSLITEGVSAVRFESGERPCPVAAGERQVVGWVRLSADRKVQLQLEIGGETPAR